MKFSNYVLDKTGKELSSLNNKEIYVQIIRYFLLPSIKSDLILSFTSVTISLLSYSTVMGVIGAGGLGEFAYRYGYQEYDYKLMYLVVIIFVIYVFIIQSIGYGLAKNYINKKEK